jgi:hypothetical protein
VGGDCRRSGGMGGRLGLKGRGQGMGTGGGRKWDSGGLGCEMKLGWEMLG